MVDEAYEVEIRDDMLEAGMAMLWNVKNVARRLDGREIINGMFAVPSSASKDRLIIDLRPASAGERRLRWGRLPYGPMFLLLVLNDNQEISIVV